MACFGALCCRGRAHQNGSKKESDWRVFALKELQAATNNFNYDNKIGEGVFGSVYWGQLWDASQIAVKRLKVWSARAELEFSVQVELLGRVRHKNLLSLRGYCAEGQERLIVYEYMPDASLYSHLHGQHVMENLLDWAARMRIAVGVAEGISYLHHSATPRIVHGGIKASNVLLGRDLEARVADFGMARLVPRAAEHEEGKAMAAYQAKKAADEAGIPGSKASEAGDVYSYGVLVLEMVSGRRPSRRAADGTRWSIVDWALPLLAEGDDDDGDDDDGDDDDDDDAERVEAMIDPRLEGRYNEEEAVRAIAAARACICTKPHQRPTMLDVLAVLKGESVPHSAN